MPVLEICVVPVGTNQASFSSYISEACKIVESHGMKYQVTPTGTVVEGELSQLMSVAQRIHETPFSMGANRVVTNITIDERHDKEMNMEQQVQSVKEEM